MISLSNHDFQWGCSEVVIIYPDRLVATTEAFDLALWCDFQERWAWQDLFSDPAWWVFPSWIMSIQYVYAVYIYIIQYHLPGGAMCSSWKIWLRQLVSDDIPYMKWKIKFVFETTNQYVYIYNPISFLNPTSHRFCKVKFQSETDILWSHPVVGTLMNQKIGYSHHLRSEKIDMLDGDGSKPWYLVNPKIAGIYGCSSH